MADRFKYTAGTLKKIEELVRTIGYSLRYGKGNFRTGSCILKESHVVVVNRYLPLEARINSLLDVLATMDPDPTELNPKQRELLLFAKSQQKQTA